MPPARFPFFPLPSPDAAAHARLAGRWNLGRLFQKPTAWPVEDGSFQELRTPEGTITPLFFEGLPFLGKPTRVFAWMGVPAAATATQPTPGIVLVHGGGGTAFRDWVATWVRRGYAAIAMDTEGHVPATPEGVTPERRRHEWSGPALDGTYAHALEAVEDQHPYHAVAAIIRAHSLLRSLPGVEADCTGITGISWGGCWTEIVIALDERFRFAAPVYAAGFRGENSPALENEFPKLPPEKIRRWIELWDPAGYLPFARMPTLFVNGTNDTHFRTDVWRKTCRLPAGPVIRSLQVRMLHGHPPEGDPPEVAAFADSVVRGGPPLTEITGWGREAGIPGTAAHPNRRARLLHGREAGRAWVSWKSRLPIERVELVFTRDGGQWPEKNWETAPSIVGNGCAMADIPASATAFYFNLTDARGCVVSAEHQEAGEP